MNIKKWNRLIIYLVGMVLLAMGITMNTKTGLGVSPIVSVSYSVSTIFNFNFGNATFVWYAVFVVAELVLHWISDRRNLLIPDLLQLPMAMVFTRLLNLFGWVLPEVTGFYADHGVLNMVIRLVVLGIAISLVGIGASMMLHMRIVANPGDGIVQALADFFRLELGLTKNCFDALCIAITAIVDLFSGRLFLGIGAGTVLAMLGTGRAMAVFNRLCLPSLQRASGMEEKEEIKG